MNDGPKQRDKSWSADLRLVRSSLSELNQRIGACNVELAHYRALAARSSPEQSLRTVAALRDIVARVTIDRKRLEEIVNELPERLRDNTRVSDVRRALDSIEAGIGAVLAGSKVKPVSTKS